MFGRVRHNKPVKLGIFVLTLLGIYFFIGSKLAKDASNLHGMSDLALAQWSQEMELEIAQYDQPEAALEYYASQRLPDGVAALSPQMYEEAEAEIDAMPQFNITTGIEAPPSGGASLPGLSAPQAGAPWSELGPSNIGGRTRALLIDPNTPTTMYAGGVAGGVWKSTDSGSSWSLLDDYMGNMAVVSLAFDPANSNTIYAGTGEGVYNGDAVRGGGIFKTTDAGATWTQLANTASNSNFYYVMDIVVSPNNANHVYAATRTGIWKSTDAGVNWARVVNPNGANSECTDLAIRTDAAPLDTVFAACGRVFTDASIYRTTDGTTWSLVHTDADGGRTSLAIAPSNQDIIYALIASTAAGNYSGGLHQVIRSIDGGTTWTVQVANTDLTLANTLLLSNPYFGCSGTFYNQGWYDNIIAVDPTNPATVWVGGIDLFKSTDSGANWGVASVWYDDTNAWYVHADQHALVFHPNYNGTTNQTLFVGNDGGIFRTNAAVSGVTEAPCAVTGAGMIQFGWTALNNGYNVTQFYHGDTYPNGTTFFGGTQDNGTNRGTTASTSWTEIFGGDGGYVAVDPSSTNVLFEETTYLSIRKSIDSGTNFNPSTTGITEASTNFQFINPFIMDPNNSQILWTGGHTLWRTDNQGTLWIQASTLDLTGGGNNSIASWAVQPGNSDLVLAGDEVGNIYLNASATTATNTTVWTDVANMGGFVSSITFDPNTTTTVYATVSTFGATHLWRSTDSGVTWAAFGGALPDVPFHSVLVETGDSTRIYVGTDRGIFVTPNGGTTWYYAQGFPRVPVEWMDMESDSGTEYLYAFTHGRSVLRSATPIPTNVTLQTLNASELTANTNLPIIAISALFVLTTGAFWRRRRKQQAQ